MRRLRQAPCILAKTEADGVPARFAAAAQISARFTATAFLCPKTQSSRYDPGGTEDNPAPRDDCLMQFILH
jgi:hypothetical protein